MIRRALAAALSLGACARGVRPNAATPREGWLQEVSEPFTMRASSGCERLAARAQGESARDADDGIARTVVVDLDGDGRDERVVFAIRRETVIAVTGSDCVTRWRGVEGDGARLQGPTLPRDPWSALPAALIQRLEATDRIPQGATTQLYIVRGAGRARHALLVRVGSLGPRRYGWRALVLSCREARCQGERLGHVEYAPLPREAGCGVTARTNRPPPDIEVPLLRVAPGDAPGVLALTPHARLRDTCALRATETLRALDTVRAGE